MLVGVLFLAAPAAQALGPSVSADPAGQSAGGTVTLSGSGFTPLLPITFTFDGVQITPSSGAVSADSTGSFSGVTITVPSNASVGSHSIVASDGTSNATTTLNVDSASVTPASGSPATGLTVSGGGWTPGDTVKVSIGGSSVCSLVADAQGNISGGSTDCLVPDLPAGSYPVAAADQSSSAQADGGSFTVVPAVAVSPAGQSPGGTVTLSGSGFAAGSTVTFTFDGAPLPTNPASVTAGTDGSFSGAMATVPSSASIGSHQIAATDASANTASTNLNLDSISVSPDGQSAGGTVTLNGSGFAHGSTVTFTLDGSPIATNPATVTTDGTGSFSGATITVPSGATLGSHTLAASDGTNDASTPLNVDKLSATPAGQSPGGTVTLSGSNFAPNSTVRFTLDGTSIATNPATVNTDSTGSFSATITVPSGTADGPHAVAAADASNNTASTSFSVDTISVSPTTGAPDNGLTISGGGWPAGDQIRTQINGQTVCQLVADSLGTLAGNETNGCRVPPGLGPGTYPVTAIDVTNNSSQATGPSFTVPSAPVAAFTAPGPASPGTTLTFTSTSAAPSAITSYDWNWGDGTTHGSTATATHSYATAGNYVVTLTITDSTNQSNMVSHTVSIQGPPTSSFTPTSATEPTGTPISFDGTSSSDPNGTITSYAWDFGDGSSSTQPTPSHAYARAGTYNVSLTVTDAVGKTASVTHPMTITDRAPSAAFTPTSATVLAGSNVAFDGTSSGDPDGTISSYSWNFGDGGSATGAQVSHKYFEVGTFTVSLNVVDNSGNTGTVRHQITVIAPPPLQTLILTPLAAPASVNSGRPSITPAGVVNLGQRLFCPGPGVACTVTIIATSRAVKPRTNLRIGKSLITIDSDGSAALRFRLSKLARAYLRSHGRLPMTIKITAARENLTTTRTQSLTLKR